MGPFKYKHEHRITTFITVNYTLLRAVTLHMYLFLGDYQPGHLHALEAFKRHLVSEQLPENHTVRVHITRCSYREPLDHLRSIKHMFDYRTMIPLQLASCCIIGRAIYFRGAKISRFS